jgi:hypothetical protein
LPPEPPALPQRCLVAAAPVDLTDWVSRAAGAFERSVAAGAI